MEGRQASRKFSAQIQAYARVRWPELAQVDLYEIGKRLRKEIASVFGVKRSQETLRPLMGGLKRGGARGRWRRRCHIGPGWTRAAPRPEGSV
ncbi:MAG: hypothetical protein KDM81_23130 [Verrucomicrobiae bacterium]|nr:hypothetical protein [Verrucomicrobiae bacterium]